MGLGGAFTISLHDANGVAIKNVDPGTYTLIARDHSDIHNFHLFGPGGVDVSTDIGNVEDTFKSDKHAALHGAFGLK